ncbi:MAG: hypothetical protein LBB64_01030 [Dysgonamonadaceae bacterium]|nr:hypothetical protein [Dysgonamonadaceae bacterium]
MNIRSSGLYLIRITDQSGKTYNQKVIVKR